MKLHPLTTVLARLRRTVAVHGTQVRAAAALGVSEGELSRTLKGDRAPAPKLLAALGYVRVVRYADVTAPTPEVAHD